MAVRCGNCKTTHASSVEVRACYGHGVDGMVRQMYLINRELEINSLPSQRSESSGSNGKSRSSIRLDHIPEGRYAVQVEGSELRFVHVDRPDEGKWENYIFVAVRASDDMHKLGSVNPRYGTYYGKAHDLVAALAALRTKEEQDQARIRYGLEIGVCGFCGRTLTKGRSREVGYGKICAGHHGLPW
jgi:Family of unknown function (DUF6011)